MDTVYTVGFTQQVHINS